MLETLLKILTIGQSCDLPAPEIMLEEDGDLSLDYGPNIWVCINPSGGINWSIMEPSAHGTDIDELERLLYGKVD